MELFEFQRGRFCVSISTREEVYEEHHSDMFSNIKSINLD